MENIVDESSDVIAQKVHWTIGLRNTVYILIALFLFLFALDLMISSLEHIGKGVTEAIILATANPFTGLFIGLLITAIIQSSSAVTSIVVALTASGAITLEAAVPIIIGSNIGTTITSALISVGFITHKKEFRRAVAAGTYHSLFNILTAAILFPLEYYYGFLSKASRYLATTFFNEPIGPMKTGFSFLGSGFKPLINFLIGHIHNGIIIVGLSVILIFGSILFFRKILSEVLGVGSQARFQKFFFRSPLKSLAWGLVTTAAIRSSTVTTSLVVPLVAKKVVKLRLAVPFILGANVGTTITAFIAAMFNSNAAISIAIAHFLFNFIGLLIFFLIPFIKDIPLNLAAGLGKLTGKYRVIGFLYLLLTFFFIPFTLIYFNKNNIVVHELVYERHDYVNDSHSTIQLMSKTMANQSPENWDAGGERVNVIQGNEKIISIYRKNNLLLMGDELFELNAPGYCREGRNKRHTICIREVEMQKSTFDPVLDSIYTFEEQLRMPDIDSSSTWYFVDATKNILLKKEKRSKRGKILLSEELIKFETR